MDLYFMNKLSSEPKQSDDFTKIYLPGKVKQKGH
jgi:hypothetical protein